MQCANWNVAGALFAVLLIHIAYGLDNFETKCLERCILYFPLGYSRCKEVCGTAGNSNEAFQTGISIDLSKFNKLLNNIYKVNTNWEHLLEKGNMEAGRRSLNQRNESAFKCIYDCMNKPDKKIDDCQRNCN